MAEETINLLLRQLLDDSSAQREQLNVIQTNMFSKSDFGRFEDKLDERLSEWDKQLGRVVRIQGEQEQTLKQVSDFRKGVLNGASWFTRAAIVAGLGIIATLLPYHFGVAEGQHATPTPTPIVTPLIVPTPEYVPHIKKLRH